MLRDHSSEDWGGWAGRGRTTVLAFHMQSFSLLSCPGRNEPLKKERLKWKSDYPMTDGQLRSKRDEFWDTAPAFEGRKEIWDALKAAAYAAEANDHELAQAILDGASITLPHGQWAGQGLSPPEQGGCWGREPVASPMSGACMQAVGGKCGYSFVHSGNRYEHRPGAGHQENENTVPACLRRVWKDTTHLRAV